MTQDFVVDGRLPKAAPSDKGSLAYIWFAARRDFKALYQETADELHDLRWYQGAAQEARFHHAYSLYLEEGAAMKANKRDPVATWLSMTSEQRAQFQSDYHDGLVPHSHPLATPASDAAQATYEASLYQGQLEKLASQIEPPAEGLSRLWRVEPSQTAKNPEWLDQALEASGVLQARGRWYTDDLAAAGWYAKDQHGADPQLVYVDITHAQREAFRVSNAREIVAGKSPAAFSRDPSAEFFVARDIADARKDAGRLSQIDVAEVAGYARKTTKPARLVTISFDGKNPWLSDQDFNDLRQERRAIHAKKMLEPEAYSNVDMQRGRLITARIDEHSSAARWLADTAQEFSRLVRANSQDPEKIKEVGALLDQKLADRREVHPKASMSRHITRPEIYALFDYGQKAGHDDDMRRKSRAYHYDIAKVREQSEIKSAPQQRVQRVEFEPIGHRKASEGRALGR